MYHTSKWSWYQPGKILLIVLSGWFLAKRETIYFEAYIETLKRRRTRIRWVRPNLSIDDVLLQQDNARPHTNIGTRETITSLRRTTLPHPPYSPDLAPSDYPFSPHHEREFKRQTLCHWRGSENCSDEVAQSTNNRILRGRDTCPYSKVERCYWEKRWQFWEVRMWFREDRFILMHDSCSSVGN